MALSVVPLKVKLVMHVFMNLTSPQINSAAEESPKSLHAPTTE